MARRPSDRDMEARWRGLDFDAIAWNLEQVLGPNFDSKLTRLAWDELPQDVREKIKDSIKRRKAKMGDK